MSQTRKTSPGFSAPMPVIRPPGPRTRSIAATSPRARRACRSPSTCRRRRAMTAITSWRAARSARSACRSRIWATCGRCSTQIPLEQMNTSMTINATAPWLLALYIAVAEEQGADVAQLQGTVQNDIIKEYLSRGTYVCPPRPSLRMITDVAAYTREHLPKWNPMNVCSYHLQEAGATPEQELAFALATATAVLDDLKTQGPGRAFPRDGRPHLVLRERGHPLRHRDVQDARLRRSLGRDLPRPLRRDGREVPPLPLWRSGQLALA